MNIIILIYLVLGLAWSQWAGRFYARRMPAIQSMSTLKLALIMVLETIFWPIGVLGFALMRRHLPR